MRLFSKLSVLHSLLLRSTGSYQYMAVAPERRLSSIHMEKIDYCGEAYTFRKFGTVEIDNHKQEKHEVFLPLKDRTSEIANKVALVAGGSQEMGLLCIRSLLASGAKAIMIADTDEEEGRNVICELSREFGEDKTAFIKTDLANIKLLRNAFNWTKKHFRSIDIVINIARPVQAESWQEQLQKNVEGIVRGTLLGVEYMSKHNGGGGGAVFNLVVPAPAAGAGECPVFAGARHFVIAFGQAMARRGADDAGVKVVTLCVDAAEDGGEEASGKRSMSCDFANLVLMAKNGSVWST